MIRDRNPARDFLILEPTETRSSRVSRRRKMRSCTTAGNPAARRAPGRANTVPPSVWLFRPIGRKRKKKRNHRRLITSATASTPTEGPPRQPAPPRPSVVSFIPLSIFYKRNPSEDAREPIIGTSPGLFSLRRSVNAPGSASIRYARSETRENGHARRFNRKSRQLYANESRRRDSLPAREFSELLRRFPVVSFRRPRCDTAPAFRA